jgi:hypothetical protein
MTGLALTIRSGKNRASLKPREKGAFIIGFETAWNMIHYPEKAASIFQGCNASEAAGYPAYVVSNAIEN